MVRKSVKYLFAIHEVVALTGFTKYMLDYLARDEIFPPSSQIKSGRGVKRFYSYADVVLLRALHGICANSGKIRHLRSALSRFRDEFGPIKPGQKLNQQLFVQGQELCCLTNSESGRQLRSGQLTFSFVVDLAGVSEEIGRCIVLDAGERGFKLAPEMADRAETERLRIWTPIRARRMAKG